MKIGTKSLLFGVHQFIWHPLTVLLAWRKLYNQWPDWRTVVCIIIHDWGYWGCDNMDGSQGELHPVYGARLAKKWLDKSIDGVCETCAQAHSTSCFLGHPYATMVLLHSSSIACKLKREPSKLCWPDKLSIAYEPAWWYLFRARLTGELKEYVKNGARHLNRPLTDREWFDWAKNHMITKAQQRRPSTTRIATNY